MGTGNLGILIKNYMDVYIATLPLPKQTNYNQLNGLKAFGNAIEDYFGRSTIDTPALAINQYYTLPHGLGVIPGQAEMRGVCISAELGFSIDDEAMFVTHEAAGSYRLLGLNFDITNIYISTFWCSAGLWVARKDTGASVAVTMNKWKCRIRYRA
jgi:hypothetical protein